MTGLETILEQIVADAAQEAAEIAAAAEQEKEKMLSAAKEKADEVSKAVLQSGEEKAAALRERAESTAQMQRRNALLTCKQRLIAETIQKTKESLANASDAEYFATLTALAAKFAKPGKATLYFNQKDLARVPGDFAEKLKAAAPQTEIQIATEPYQIKNGFVLVYGGIEINCTLDAVFEGAQAELSDAVNHTLWKVTA